MAEPTVTLEQQVLTELHAGLHRIIYAHLFILVLLLSTVGVGGYMGVKSYDRALERADALQQQFSAAQATAVASQKQLADLLEADATQRAQETAKETILAQGIAKRDAQAPVPVIQSGLQSNANLEQVTAALTASFASDSSFGQVKLSPPDEGLLNQAQMQKIITTKVSFDRMSLDLKDETDLFSLEQTKSKSVETDLSACESTVSKDETALKAAQKTIDSLDKTAHQSKFRKILGSIGRNMERVGILLVGVEVGHRL